MAPVWDFQWFRQALGGGVRCNSCENLVHQDDIEAIDVQGHPMRYSIRCWTCGRAEMVLDNGMGGRTRDMTWGSAHRLVRCPCGVELRETQMIMVAHHVSDGTTMLLDRCPDCASKQRCPIARNGLHEPKSWEPEQPCTIGPRPPDVGFAKCACGVEFFYAYGEGCSGYYTLLSWPALAALWEHHNNVQEMLA